MRALLLSVSLSLVSTVALADPVVNAGGKPGVAKSWSAAGSSVVLVVADGYDANEVAAAIAKNVKGAKAKAKGGKVLVSGVAEAKLLAALEGVEVDRTMDDVDQLLTDLQGGGDDEEGSGSSIRATKLADFSDVLGKPSGRLEGKVTGVTRSRFPLVMVSVVVSKVPAGVKGIKKGDRITVIPRVKSKNGVVDPNDRPSQLNIGAWYSQEGDHVTLNLEKKPKKSYWIARGFERKPD
ncbi:MAG: hypothetical protein RMA76_01845 [Deltaproteobacteria bacterium]|jgi:hypothetical protein